MENMILRILKINPDKMKANTTIAIGCDHAGYAYRHEIIQMLSDDYSIIDHGTTTADSVDYPDFAHLVSKSIASGDATYGILICGTANGVAITANKHKDVRAGIAWIKEIASLIRQHNNSNILCIPARYTSIEQAKSIVYTYLNTPFEGGRHEKRVNKICI